MQFKRYFLSGALAALLFSGAKPFVQFGRGCYEEQFCEIIMNLGQWVKKRCRLKDFLSGALWQPSCLVEQNRLCNLERGHHRKHTCEDI